VLFPPLVFRVCSTNGVTALAVLSGQDVHKKTFVRVSTDRQDLVVLSEVSPYLLNSGLAFETFILDEHKLSDMEKKYALLVLKHHPKKPARLVAASKAFGRSDTTGKFHEQRIRLPRECLQEFAKASDGDEFFYGKKFVQYPDGSVHLHIELLCVPKDGFKPEEVREAPVTRVASVPTEVGGPQAMDTSKVYGTVSGATVLHNEFDATDVRERSFKRTCTSTPVQQMQPAMSTYATMPTTVAAMPSVLKTPPTYPTFQMGVGGSKSPAKSPAKSPTQQQQPFMYPVSPSAAAMAAQQQQQQQADDDSHVSNMYEEESVSTAAYQQFLQQQQQKEPAKLQVVDSALQHAATSPQ